MVGLLALSVLPAVFCFLGKKNFALFAGFLFLGALSTLASVQNAGRNMTVFVPVAVVWILFALVIAGLAGAAGSFWRHRAGQVEG